MNKTAKKVFFGVTLSFLVAVGVYSSQANAVQGGFKWIAQSTGSNVGGISTKTVVASAETYEWR